MLTSVAPVTDTTQGASAHEQILARHKTIPNEIRDEILKALSFYPEFGNTEIDFVFSSALKSSLMQAQPKARTLLRRKHRRGYIIRISRYFHLSQTHVPIETLPKEVLIGWLGHELGHVLDYCNRGRWRMATFGAGYAFSKKYVKRAERTADTFAVQRGLLPYILATKNFILGHADLPVAYKQKIRRLYMSPDDVMTLVEKTTSK